MADSGKVCPELHQDLRGNALALADQAKQDVLGADVVVAQLESLAQREFQHLLGPWGEGNMTGRSLLALSDYLLDLLTHGAEGDVQRLKGLGRYSLAFMDEAEQYVLGSDVVVVEHARLFLGKHDNATGTVGKSLKHAAHS